MKTNPIALALLGIALIAAPAAHAKNSTAPKAAVEAHEPAHKSEAAPVKTDGAPKPGKAENTQDAAAKKDKKRPKFSECDTNGDDFLSKEEYLACYPKSAAKFDAMDADNDGRISREEIKAYQATKKVEKKAASKKDKHTDN